jgi:hypothetical protein
VIDATALRRRVNGCLAETMAEQVGPRSRAPRTSRTAAGRHRSSTPANSPPGCTSTPAPKPTPTPPTGPTPPGTAPRSPTNASSGTLPSSPRLTGGTRRSGRTPTNPRRRSRGTGG